MSAETGVFFTLEELRQLNRIFNVVSEVDLKANYFTKTDIENVYSVIGKVREGIHELELEQS